MSILAEKEEAGPSGAPAAVIEELSPRVDVDQRALEYIISPDPGRPDGDHDDDDDDNDDDDNGDDDDDYVRWWG